MVILYWEVVEILDLAWCLDGQCRVIGMCLENYSPAQFPPKISAFYSTLLSPTPAWLLLCLVKPLASAPTSQDCCIKSLPLSPALSQ